MGMGKIIAMVIGFAILLCAFKSCELLDETTPESRVAASSAKYKCNVGLDTHYFNEYASTNDTISFYDILRQKEFIFIGKKLEIESNK